MVELSREAARSVKFTLSRLWEVFCAFVVAGVLFYRFGNRYVNIGVAVVAGYALYRLYKRYRRRCPRCKHGSFFERYFLSLFVIRYFERETPPPWVRDPHAWLSTVRCRCPFCGHEFFEKEEVKSFEHRIALFRNW